MRIAGAFEDEAVDDANGQCRQALGQIAQGRTRDCEHDRVARGRARPNVLADPEHFWAAAEIAGHPISQGDLAPRRGRVENPHRATLDEINTVVLLVLAKQRLAAFEHARPALSKHHGAAGGIEPAQKVGLRSFASYGRH